MEVHNIKLSESDILCRFSEMEAKFPRNEGKNYYPSLDFYLKYFDDKEGAIREEANRMIEFAGLGTYSSNVKFAILDGSAGNIVLNNDLVAEITIDEGIAQSIDAVMATLAHEISHKVLHKNGIFYKGFFDRENEVCADLAAFYLGFGDLIMKGYKMGKFIMGYLSPETYAMAYVLITVINKNIEYNINNLPMHARIEIEKAQNKCELLKTNFGSLCQDNYNDFYSDTFSEIRKIYEYYDLIIAAIPEIQKSFSFLSKNLSDAFYNFDKKELEWHKFSIAFNAFVCLKPDDNNNIILQKLKNHFNSAFFSIFRVLNLNRDLSKLKNIERHCPNCGFTINKVLEPREYHLVCPKCKTHFIIDGDIKRIIDSASSLDRDITDKECKAILENERLKKEINRLTNELDKYKVEDRIIKEDNTTITKNKKEDLKNRKNEKISILNKLMKRYF